MQSGKEFQAEWQDTDCFTDEEVEAARPMVEERLKAEGYPALSQMPDNNTIIRHYLRQQKREEAWDAMFGEPEAAPESWWGKPVGCVHDGEKTRCPSCGWRYCAECATLGTCPRCRVGVKPSP